jgi:hypothetical protein
MPDQNKEFPKVPPFIIEGTSGKAAQGPETQSAHMVQPPRNPVKNDNNLSQLGILSSLVSVISVICMGVALISGAWFAYSVLILELKDDILSRVIVVGLAYAIGWILSAFGLRVLGNFWLPYAIQIYTWVVLVGIIILQILIMSRLYQQEYHFSNYVKYLSLFVAGMITLVGLHLLLKEHSLRPFGFLLLLTSLGHFYIIIVYHYIFTTDVQQEKVWGDLIFFFVTTTVSLLMLAHFGMLNRLRNFMDRTFTPIDNPFVPPE